MYNVISSTYVLWYINSDQSKSFLFQTILRKMVISLFLYIITLELILIHTYLSFYIFEKYVNNSTYGRNDSSVQFCRLQYNFFVYFLISSRLTFILNFFRTSRYRTNPSFFQRKRKRESSRFSGHVWFSKGS